MVQSGAREHHVCVVRGEVCIGWQFCCKVRRVDIESGTGCGSGTWQGRLSMPSCDGDVGLEHWHIQIIQLNPTLIGIAVLAGLAQSMHIPRSN